MLDFVQDIFWRSEYFVNVTSRSNYTTYSTFSTGVDNKQADAGRDGRTYLAKPNTQARTGIGNFFFPVRLTTSRIGKLARLIRTLLEAMTI